MNRMTGVGTELTLRGVCVAQHQYKFNATVDLFPERTEFSLWFFAGFRVRFLIPLSILASKRISHWRMVRF